MKQVKLSTVLSLTALTVAGVALVVALDGDGTIETTEGVLIGAFLFASGWFYNSKAATETLERFKPWGKKQEPGG